MKRLILSLGILISALTSNVVMAQSSPCLNDVTAPDTNWTAGNVGRTSANPLIIKLNPAGYAAIVADSGNGQAGVNLAKVFVPSQFTLANSAYTVVSALDDCASSYTGTLAAKWPKFTISKGAFTCADVNASSVNPLAVTFNVFDANNNVRSGTIYIKVVEQVDPTLVTKNTTVTLSATGTASIVESDVVQSKSDNCGTPTVTLSQSVFTCDDLGSNTIQVTATDAAGNDVVQNATVTVLDATAPVVTLQAATIYLDALGSASVVENDVIDALVEACDGTPTITITPNTFDCTDKGANTVTVTVTDGSGNQYSGTTTVTIVDDTAPSLSVQTATVYLNASGSASVSVSDVLVSTSDNCDVPTVTVTPNSWTCTSTGAQTVTVKSVDAAGNETSLTTTVTVLDNIDPSLATQNVTLSLNASGSATLTEALAVVSKSDNCGTPSITLSQTSFSCSDVGTVSVDVTATDASNNTTTNTITVTVEDNMDPTVTLLSGPFAFNLGADGTVTVSTSDFVSSTDDNCGVASVTVSPNSFDCTDLGSNTVTITVTDDNGNVTTTTASVTISDAQAPVFVSGSAFATGTWDFTYTSGSKLWISGSQPFTRMQLDVPNGTGYAQVGTAFNAVGITPYKPFKGASAGGGRKVAMLYNANQDTVYVTYTNVNANNSGIGSVDTCVGLRQDADNFLIMDSNVPGSILYEFTSPVNNLVFGDYRYTNTAKTVKISVDAPTFTVTAANDYPSTFCSYNPSGSYTLVDNTVPGVGAFETTVVLGSNGTGSFDVNAEFGSSVEDNCEVASLVAAQSTFDCSEIGTHEILMTATDGSGNTSSDTILVTVVDQTAPFLTQLTYDRNLRNGFALLTVQEVLSAIASDNCEVDYATSALSREYFDCNDVGSNTVTASIRDMSGNFAFVNFTVIIHDTIMPEAIAVSTYTVELDEFGQATVSAEDVDDGSSDNCNNFTMSLSQTDFDCSNLGNNTVTFTVEDEEGNQATASVTIVVEDNLDPVWNFTSTVSASCEVVNLDYTALGELRVKDANGVVIPVVSTSQSSNYGDACSFTSPTALTDNDYATGIATDYESGAFIQVDLGSVQTVGSLELGALDNTCAWGSYYTDNLYVYGSTDGVVFNYMFDVNGTSETSLTTFNLASAASVRYLKFSINASGNTPVNGVCITDNMGYVGFSEIQVTDANGNLPIVNMVASSTWDADANGWPGCDPAQTLGSIQDSDAATGVGTDEETAAQVWLDLGDWYSVTSVKIMPITGCSWDEDDLDGDQIFVSNNNSSWYHLGTVNGSLNGSFTTIVDTLNFPVRYVKVLSAYVTAPTPGSTTNNEPEVTLYLDANGAATLDVQATYGSYASDNCDVVVSANKTSFTCADAGDVSVVLTATDDSGNFADYTVTVSVLDTLSPDLQLVSSYDLYLDASGQATLDFTDIDNGTSDNCTQLADLTVVLSQTNFDCGLLPPPVAPGGASNQVTVTATDLAGNSRTKFVNVIVHDTLAPVASVSSVDLLGQSLDANGSFTFTLSMIDGLVSFTDNCEVTDVYITEGSNTLFSCTDAGVTRQIYVEAVDEAGNATTIVVNVEVVDDAAPVWNLVAGPNNQQNSGSSVLNDPALFNFEFGFCDAEDAVTSSQVVGKLYMLNGGSYTVELTDCYGDGWLGDGEIFDLQLQQKNSSGVYTTFATYGAGFVDGYSVENCISSLALNANGNPTFVGDTVRFYFSYTSGPFFGEAGFNIFSGCSTSNPISATVSLDNNGSASIDPQVLFASYASDNCDFTVTADQTSFDCLDADNSPITITLTATDASGNFSTTTADITVLDEISPVADVVASYSAVLDANGSVTIAFSDIDNGSYDNCDFTATLDNATFTCANIGNNTLTGSLVDPSGNSTNFSVSVTISDDASPVFDSEFTAANTTVYAVQYDCFGLVNVDADALPTVTDNCDNNVSVVRRWNGQVVSGTIPMPVGQHTLWAVATDDYGNTDSTAYAYVDVVDTTLPDATFWNNVTLVLGANGTVNVTPAAIIDASFDNCGIQNVSIVPNVLDCDDLNGGGLITWAGPSAGYVTLTVTLTDFNGNARTYFPMVAVEDQSAPVVTPLAGAATVALNGSGSASVVVADVISSVTDNCTVASVTLSQTDFDCTDLGVNNVVVTAVDASGNTTNYTVALNVVDNLAPVYDVQNITVSLNANGNVSIAAADLIDGSITDNCSSVFVSSLSKSVFDCSNVGLNTVSVTVTDQHGNSSVQNATVTVVDDIDPSLTLANSSVTVALNASGVGTLGTSEVVGLVSDNCGIQSVVLSQSSFDCSDLGTGTVTVTATDVNGNTTVATQNIVVVDLIAPVVAVKSTATVKQLDASGNATIAFADVLSSVVDNCTSSPTVVWTPTTVSCAQVGPVTVSITATDASGNATSTTKVIQVVDELAPALVTKSYTAILNANGNASIVESNVVVSKSDNCGVPAVTLSKTVFDCTNKGLNNVLVSATDVNGNVTTQTAVVTVVDQTAPFFTTASSLTVLLNASGTATISVPAVVTSSGDNCDVPTVALSKYTFTCSDMPSTTITVTATDASGNTTTAPFVVTVLDQLAPVITPKSTPTTIALDASGSAPVTLADIMGQAVDNCTAAPVVTWFPTTVTCAQVGAVTVTISAADASGNVSNSTKVIQVVDNIAPTVVLNGTSLVNYTLPLNASGNATLTVGNVVNSATDNCGTPTVTLSKTSFDCSNLGDNVVVVTAVDQYGNVKTSNAIVKVVDVTAPVLVTPSTQVVVSLSASGSAALPLNQVMLSATDNCGTPTVTWSPNSFNCANLGNNTVTVVATDASGNVTTSTVVVLVQDVTAPSIATVAGSVTKVLGANGTAVISQSDVVSSVSDACDNASTITWTPTTVSCANVGNVAVVVTAVDASGNVSTAVKTVLVVDQTAPVISAPASITLNLNAAGTVALPAGVASATDNCSVGSIQYSKSLFDCSNLGVNTVTVTATDAYGNTSTANMSVSVVDNSAPTLTLVASPVTVALNASGSATVNAAQLVANAFDNCAVSSYTVAPSTFNCSNLGGNTVTVTATDASGNATSQTVTVNVVDVTGPSITVNPAAVTVTLNANGVGSVTNAQVVSTVTDNCTSTPSVVVTPNVFTCADLGQQMVTIFATDAAGNISTTTKLINVVDATAPVVVSAPQNVTLPGCNGNFTYAYQVTDNCGYTATLVSGLASGTQFPVGTTTVTWSFADASGNTTTHSFNVTVLPLGTYTLPSVNEYCAGHGHFDLTSGQVGLVFYGSSVYNNGTTFYTEVPGVYALNYVFTDANGCTQNGVFNLIVRPRPVKPTILQVAATTLESSVTGATYQWYRNEQPIVGAKNKQYVFTSGGKYEVVVFNAYGCGTMSEGFVINANGLSVEEIITSVRLFPNPTSSSVTLETSFEAGEDYQVTLVDMLGSVVYRGTMAKGSNQHVVSMEDLAAGTYNVILTNASGASSNVQRVVKID